MIVPRGGWVGSAGTEEWKGGVLSVAPGAGAVLSGQGRSLRLSPTGFPSSTLTFPSIQNHSHMFPRWPCAIRALDSSG
eukprot:2169570-Rhodomonas_salina.3